MRARLIALTGAAALAGGMVLAAVPASGVGVGVGCAGVPNNLLTNCGFETRDLTGWTSDAGISASVVSSGATGSYSAEVTNSDPPGTLSQSLATTAGTTYVLRFALKDYANPGERSFAAQVTDGAGTRTLYSYSSTATYSTTWRYQEVSFTTDGPSTISFTFSSYSVGWWLFDDVSVASYSSPVVTADPVATTVDAGQTATFTAAATGVPFPSVQWQRSADGTTWTDLAGQTSTTLSFTTSYADNQMQYRAMFSSLAGSKASDAAVLTVNPPPVAAPTVTQQPTSYTATSGTGVTFTSVASGWPTPTVQWQSSPDGVSWTDVPGATSTSLVFSATYAMSGTRYHAVFTNSEGSATSDAALLNVKPLAPRVTSDPKDTTVVSGQSATFTAAADGDPAPTVQWQVSTDSGTTWSDVDGATSATLSFTTTYAMRGRLYHAVFTNLAGHVTTKPAGLKVTASTASVTNLVGLSAKGYVTVTYDKAGDPAPYVECKLDLKGTSYVACPSGTTFKAQGAKTFSLRWNTSAAPTWTTTTGITIAKK